GDPAPDRDAPVAMTTAGERFCPSVGVRIEDQVGEPVSEEDASRGDARHHQTAEAAVRPSFRAHLARGYGQITPLVRATQLGPPSPPARRGGAILMDSHSPDT